MIKKILSVFGYKVFTKSEYEELLNKISRLSNYYRSFTEERNYHHHDTTVTIPLRKLGNICLVENCVWEDIKDRIYRGNI